MHESFGHYPQANKISGVLDHVATHTNAALYDAFAPEAARRIAAKLESHVTPKHRSWRNMVASEFSVLSSQCLNRRRPDFDLLAQDVKAWTKQRNHAQVTGDGPFTTPDARSQRKRLEPILHPAK